ncbi:MAG: D-alanyl-D-alanine carboxypeptidase [Clostridia bacterium]|nr:D-alanyl-D-alanine carboxypeptidase [Clostridia bacterium]
MIKNKTKIIYILLLMLLILTISMSNKPIVYGISSEMSTSAKGMVVYEGVSDTVLYGNNSNDRLPMASTTKIATAIVAIENCNDLKTPFIVSNKAVGVEGTSIYLKDGEAICMYDLLLGLMLASGNDCAIAIAEYFGYENFMNLMQELVLKLELSNTHFDNPHGLDSDTHYTSAYDLAVITDYALDNELFREICSTERAIIPKTNVSEERYLKHKNKLLFSMENCIGVKTGFTDNAGRCLVNAHEENGMRVISVVLNCGPMFEECERLTNKALSEYVLKEFISPYSYVTDINVVGGEKNKISVVTINEFTKAIKQDDLERYSVKYDVPDVLEAPVELNSVVGKAYVYYDDEIIFESNLIAIDETRNIDIKYILNEILEKW